MLEINKITSDTDIVEQLLRHLSAKRQVEEISKQFSVIETNARRVDYAYRLLDGYDLLPALIADVKNNESSLKMRQKGNEMFKLRKHSEAVECYTKSIALAENGCEYLSLAFANRSAVLFEKGFYRECLMDIDWALLNDYPEKLRPKLLSRQNKAKQMESKQIVLNHFQPIPEIPENHRNKSIQCAADSIEIKFTENQGRHVVAKRDLSVGEVLAIEKPFCHVLIEQYYNHCHNCLKFCYNLIPCPRCTQVLYCNEECREKAATYHSYECKILATLRKMKMDKLKMVSLKIALLVKDQYSKIKEISKVDEELYRSDRYVEIHKLIPNTSSRSVSDLFKRSSSAAILFHLVKDYTDFFQSQDEETTFKELVLLHMQTSACNFHEISEMAENQNEMFEPNEIGAGAYSFLSMFNHKCSPNVLRNCYGPVIVVRALETIKKGEQCFDNYGYHHALMPKIDRKSKLKNQYFFDCSCEVCVSDWPLYQDLKDIQTDVCLDEEDILKLHGGNTEVAKRVLEKILPRTEQLEKVKPNKNLAEMQEIIKQCFALLGNVRRTI